MSYSSKRKIRVKINGRLGNQLFQYAFARRLQIELGGGDILLDFSLMGLNYKTKVYSDQWDNFLKHFNVHEYEYVDCGNYVQNKESVLQRIVWKLGRRIRRCSHMLEYMIERIDYPVLSFFGMYYMESYNCSNHILKPLSNNIWLRGWFESASFFKNYDSIICGELTLKNSISEELNALRNKLEELESVCVHVRRGDFVSSDGNNLYRVCSKDYYEKGINYIRKYYPDVTVFLCSDDLDWCLSELALGKNVICEPANIKCWELLHIMTACHHFVISNSTFAWWAQHLSSSPNKIVIAPHKWRNEEPRPLVKDVFEDNWICM